jgi:DNA replication protein DnaC
MLRPVPDREGSGRRPECPLKLCEGNGFILRDDGEAVPCECRDGLIGRGVSRGMGTGIPKRYREVSFTRKPICDLDHRILTEVRAFVDGIEDHLHKGRGIWFAGDLGTGKTSLAMLVSKAAEQKGRSVAIYPFTRLLAEIKDTYDGTTAHSYMSLYRRLCAVDLLQLDDVGAEKRTDWVLEQLYSVVNERWQDERSIVITTNTVDLDKLREEIGPRTVSRLIGMCGNPIPLWGPDLRLTSTG